MADDKRAPNLDRAPPGPPESMVRPGLASMVASRDGTQSGTTPPTGTMPGIAGPNAIATKAMEVEQKLGELAQLISNPAPIADIVARLRAAVVPELQGSAAPPTPGGGGLAGVVAPPGPMSPPAMGGMGMPAPPMA
jgi:hypothetical protein